MKDYLEDEVDEKYYINNEKAQKLIDKLISDGTIPESRAEQSRAEQSRAEQTCISFTVREPRRIEVANCISARTDRGISNRKSEGSGVVQLQKD